MSSCSRCGAHCEIGTLHVFRGGESRRKLTEIQTGRTTTLCAVLIPDDEPDEFRYDRQTNSYQPYRTALSNKQVEDNAQLVIQMIEADEN